MNIAPIFTFSFLGKLASSIFEAVFAPNLALLILAPFNSKAFRNSPALRLLLAAAIALLALRFGLLLLGLPLTRRYFLPLSLLLSLMAAAGLPLLIQFAAKACPWLRERKGMACAALAGAILIACSAKALNPSFDKTWMREAGAYIKAHAAPGARQYICSDDVDNRISYYADASRVDVVISLEDDGRSLRKLAVKASQLKSEGSQLFIVVRESSAFEEALKATLGEESALKSFKKVRDLNAGLSSHPAVYEAQ